MNRDWPSIQPSHSTHLPGRSYHNGSGVGAYMKTEQSLNGLTPRQKDVLLLICDGLSGKEIAARLHVSPKTIDIHKMRITDHLGIHSTALLVRYAVRTGLIDP
jgi:DNA-binding NarL/FixJ family response regulator